MVKVLKINVHIYLTKNVCISEFQFVQCKYYIWKQITNFVRYIDLYIIIILIITPFPSTGLQTKFVKMAVKFVLLIYLATLAYLIVSVKAYVWPDPWLDIDPDLIDVFSTNHDKKPHHVVKKVLKPANYQYVESLNDWVPV